MKSILTPLFLLGFAAMLHGADARGVRTWTDTSGRTLQASLLGFDAGQVMLQLPDGRTIKLAAAQLSEADREFVGRHIAEVFDPITGKPVPMSGAVKREEMSFTAGRTWPSSLTATKSLLFAREAGYDDELQCRKFRTRRFEYLLHNGVGISEEIARVFEGTYELLRASPWGIQAQPQENFFRAEIFPTMESYYAAGAPQGSAGVYLLNKRIFMLPLQSLGLNLPAGYRVVDPARQMGTIIHEMTHMMMHDVLDMLPMWFTEGSAEYTACIPCEGGTFVPPRVGEGAARRLLGFSPAGAGLQMSELLEFDMRQWQRFADTGTTAPPPPGSGTAVPVVVVNPGMGRMEALYDASLLFTYYFMNLEGDRKGTHLLQFLEAVRKEQPQWKAWREDLFRYITARDEFLAKPEVKRLPNGTFTYPAYLSPPKEPTPPRPEYREGKVFKMHLPILLNGKTAEQVAQEAFQAVTTQLRR